MALFTVLCSVAVLLCVTSLASGALIQGAKFTGDVGPFFLGKFCFSGAHRRLDYNISVLTFSRGQRLSNVYLGVWDDEKSSWEQVYGNRSMSCQAKLADAIANVTVVSDVGGTMSLVHSFAAADAHPHFFYFGFLDCRRGDPPVRLLTYSLHAVNPDSGSLDKEFSYDLQGLLDISIVYFVFFFALILFHLYQLRGLLKLGAYHPIVRLLTGAIVLQWLAQLCAVIHYGNYATTGVGVPPMKAIGELIAFAADVVILVLLILLSKGWGMTSTFLTEKAALGGALGVLTFCYIATYIWDYLGRDPASTLYVYESVPGIIVLILRLLLLGWFMWNLRLTYREAVQQGEESKRRFFIQFGAVYSVWFVLLPIFVAILASCNPWIREKTAAALTQTLDALALSLLVFLLWPSRASRFFHVEVPPLAFNQRLIEF